jgi:hypothetical protein
MNINAHGYKLQASAPNAEGLCTFELNNLRTGDFVEIKTPCTLEQALEAARIYVAKKFQELTPEPVTVDADDAAPKAEELGQWHWLHEIKGDK